MVTKTGLTIGGIPSGSYQASCTDINWDEATRILKATCNPSNIGPTNSSVVVPDRYDDIIIDNDGKLKIDNSFAWWA